LENTSNFKPDLIIIDYMGLMSSVTSSKKNNGTYEYYKSIAEELHGFSKSLENTILLTSFQLNRSGFNNIDIEMDSIADSIGVVQTADLIIGMWGGLDLTVDPYSESTKGTIRVVAFQDIDIALRHAESFAAMQDALTV
jgi:hypothetical protein